MRDADRAIVLAKSGRQLAQDGQVLAAISAFESAVDHWPDAPGILHNLANALLSIGRVDEAIDVEYRAHQCGPSLAAVQSNLLLMLLYSPTTSPESVAWAHRQWGQQFDRVATSGRASSGERFRIAYITSNFRFSPDAFFTEPVIRCHDRSRFEIFCYSTNNEPDETTRRFQGMNLQWRQIGRLSDEEAAELIRRDRIDILVECDGHFGQSRARVCTLSPAPVQVSFPMYPATTGLPTIEYRLADQHTDPEPLADGHYTEELVRLPHTYTCYGPPEDAPEVNPLPALRNGFITFGCFNRLSKVNERVIDVWAAVLREVPDSRLLFHYLFVGWPDAPAEHCEAITQQFVDRRVPAERLYFVGARPFFQHLLLYHEVDISLDPFPYNGNTTTCESLWMGVPVVTIAGRAHAGRVGISRLTALGLADWVATSPEECLQLVVRKIRDLSDLNLLRATLRERMRCSPLTDAVEYTRALEHVYIDILTNRIT